MREGFPVRSAWRLLLAIALYGSAAVAGAVDASWCAQVATLGQALERIAALPEDAGLDARSAAIEVHWRLQQEFMRSLRRALVADGSACAQWMLMDPGPVGRTAGSAETGSARVGDCPMMSHGWQAASARGWDPPVGDVAAYLRAWQAPADEALEACAAIDAAAGKHRRALLLQRYQAGYRHMQQARGRGWMWSVGTADVMPAADSPGAHLALRYCAQCHAAPPPALQDAQGWSAILARMRAHAADAVRGGDPEFETPTAVEFDAIEAWLRAYGVGKE